MPCAVDALCEGGVREELATQLVRMQSEQHVIGRCHKAEQPVLAKAYRGQDSSFTGQSCTLSPALSLHLHEGI